MSSGLDNEATPAMSSGIANEGPPSLSSGSGDGAVSAMSSALESEATPATSSSLGSEATPAMPSALESEASSAKSVSSGEGAVSGLKKCEINHVDRKYGSSGKPRFELTKEEVVVPKDVGLWRLCAYTFVHNYDTQGKLRSTSLYVNSQPMRQLLRDVIGDYAADPIDVTDVQISEPFHSLFYYREEIEKVGTERFQDDENIKAQLQLLLDWIKTRFEQEIRAWESCIAGVNQSIQYDHLWTLFPPNTVIYHEFLEQPRAYKLRMHAYHKARSVLQPMFVCSTTFLDFDGDVLGDRIQSLNIEQYSGKKPIKDLPFLPLDIHPNARQIRSRLLVRGRKFETFLGQHYEAYDGIAVKQNEKGEYDRIHIQGRIMVDNKTSQRMDPNRAMRLLSRSFAAMTQELLEEIDIEPPDSLFEEPSNQLPAEEMITGKLSDDQVILANATVRGFSFTRGIFLEFFVDHIAPIKWNENCFDQLVLDGNTKKIVKALVSMRTKDRDSMDDIIKGKGKGLVFVLHGPPGVGKTLTAECVAEYMKRPLYMVSTGELGTTGKDLDLKLTDIMELASIWNAVLLIDEADIYLESRELRDIHRNSLVSIFLRQLEYYTGVLFLTTNRVKTFDEAFKSRIDVPIRYNELGLASRQQIWQNLCAKVPGDIKVSQKDYQKLARQLLNGRQIKNAIKVAEGIAASDEMPLSMEHLEASVEKITSFEKEMDNAQEIDYDAPGESKRAGERNMYC
ncbi:P-loop containing nucleoside triphosphate hydrolase protein [Xylariaceae sp. FL1019]|nr:P-loop containing nucleoside triphosphate hydrolase protein [Xylariaceae sp. FL1019]